MRSPRPGDGTACRGRLPVRPERRRGTLTGAPAEVALAGSSATLCKSPGPCNYRRVRFDARRVALVAVLGAVVILPWVKVVSVLHNLPAGPGTLPAEGVVWADRVFVNRAALAAWLDSRGASYRDWARNHPAVAAAPVQEVGTQTRSAHDRTAAPAPSRHAHTAPAQKQPATTGSRSWISRLAWLSLAIVLTAGLGVAVFRSLERVSEEEAEDDSLPVGELREPQADGGPTRPVRVRSSPS
jgi:hypothetical protein